MRNNPYCDLCKFQSTRLAEWKRHIITEKHKRNGLPKTKHCNICNKDLTNSFLLKIHYLTYHATSKEKIKYKHYCRVCDTIHLTQVSLYFHIIGKNHKKMVNFLKKIDIKLNDIAFMQKIYEFFKIKKYFNNIELALLNNKLNDDLFYIFNAYNV